MNIPAVILAAGESRRMGSPKALLMFQGESFLDRLIGVFGAICRPVIVVLGHEPRRILAGITRCDQAVFVENPAYRLGQLTSLQAGLRALPASTPYALFTLVDHPAVSPLTIRALLDAPGSLVAIPRFQERRGHPVRLRAEVIGEVLGLPAEGQAKSVVRAHADSTVFVDTNDPGVIEDIDDEAAYSRLLARIALGEPR